MINEYINEYGFDDKHLKKFSSELTNKSLIIYGATGGLGRSVLTLINHGIASFNEITVHSRASSDLSSWKKLPNCTFKKLTDDINITKDSLVLYLIGDAQPIKFLENPSELLYLNSQLLKDVIDANPPFLGYASTTEIYSGVMGSIKEDSHTVSHPQVKRGMYIESKRIGEAILSHCGNHDTSRLVSYRIALATPPELYSWDRRVLADICNNGIKNNIVSLKGGHHLKRQYQWGPLSMLKLIWTLLYGKETLYNLSGGEIITLETLAKEVSLYLNIQYQEQQKNIDIGAPESVTIDSSKLDNDLPVIPKKEKIKDLIKLYLRNV